MREALLQGGIRISALWIAEGKRSGRTQDIIETAGKKNIPVISKKAAELSRLLPGMAHQGIAAVVEGFVYTDLEHLIEASIGDSSAGGLLVAADHITDEGNLGALMRTAAFFDAHGLIIPRDRSAGVTANVIKRSSGAWTQLPVSRVVNLGRALDLLEKAGFWIIGASGGASSTIHGFDWKRDLVLVLGNEQRGLSRPVLKRCHELVSIPSGGRVESLNVAVAGGVILGEIARQRSMEPESSP